MINRRTRLGGAHLQKGGWAGAPVGYRIPSFPPCHTSTPELPIVLYRIRCATDLRHSDTTAYIFAVDELGGVASSGYCYTVANAGSAGTTPPRTRRSRQ